ncbi:matrix metalloproteinase-28-like [Polyodon spathula]|uniref:matrix metalloproteinase-28-like n=1 Tax=Polyodon spathula TaxID=7913 RepID=UPI001B7F5A65|nr:matrix metalloproteinase-28-like [Polyodon spathula]
MQLPVALRCFHWICFLFLLIFVSFTSLSPVLKKVEDWELETAEGFLEKYGYLGYTGNHGHGPAEVGKALREFQWLSRLPVSGLVDDATLQLMSQPRCGVTDGESHAAWEERVSAIFSGNGGKRRSKRYSQQGEKWYKRHLTYRIVNGPRSLSLLQVRRAVRAAFELWSNVSALAFWEVMEGPADIRLAFYEGEHSDGVTNAFDGPGGALAHAFFPRRGEAHFDISERWTLNGHKGRNLFIVTAHEIGHTLGLEHSPVRNALMSPYYKKLGKDLVLSWDDIAAVQQLYGQFTPSEAGSSARFPSASTGSNCLGLRKHALSSLAVLLFCFNIVDSGSCSWAVQAFQLKTQCILVSVVLLTGKTYHNALR